MQLNLDRPSGDEMRAIEARAGNRLSTRTLENDSSTLYKGGTREPDIGSGNIQLPLMFARWGM